jgi:hypothetical protein
MQLRRAERKQAKLRLGVTGPSGSGKTFSALKLARGLVDSWDKIAIIDTENGSAELYSHLGEYNVLTLRAPFSPERYAEAMKVAEDAGMEVIILDSVSHEWDGPGGILEEADRGMNNIQKWAKLTPRHRAFLNAILQSSANVITTSRKKQDWAISQDNNKTKVEKLGLKDVQRDGFEYELTLNLDIDMQHYATASKDRTGLFMDRPPFQITEETGAELRAWSGSGAVDMAQVRKDVIRELKRLEIPDSKDRDMVLSAIRNNTGLDATEEENLPVILEKLKALKVLKENIPGGADEEDEDPLAPPQKPVTAEEKGVTLAPKTGAGENDGLGHMPPPDAPGTAEVTSGPNDEETVL